MLRAHSSISRSQPNHISQREHINLWALTQNKPSDTLDLSWCEIRLHKPGERGYLQITPDERSNEMRATFDTHMNIRFGATIIRITFTTAQPRKSFWSR